MINENDTKEEKQRAGAVRKLAEDIGEIMNARLEKIDPKSFRYVIYVRKSTDEKDNQVESLPAQVEECKAMVVERELKLISGTENEQIIQESESAKESGIRPLFSKMLEDIKEGKIDGIISWHPDRLSRNLKEAGEIIDLLDRGIIKDLQFKTVKFENNPSGKTLLGMLFVMAKQYTDHLSESVMRGINNALKKGKQLNRTKHGYYKDANGFLRPDEKNWALIKNAWFMRLNKDGEREIAEYLNSKKYKIAVGTGGDKHRLCLFDKQMVSRMLKNPIYAGVLKYGEKVPRVCVLSDFYDFQAMITPEQFLQVNGGKVSGTFVASRGGEVKADLLRQRVICGYCGEEMSTGINHKVAKNVYRFYFRCESENCIFHNKSVRAKLVVNFATDLLKRATIKVEEGYEEYKKEFKVASEEKIKDLDSMRRSLSAEEGQKEKQALTIRQYILRYEKQRDKKRLIESYEGDLTKMEDRLAEIKSELKRVRYELETSKRIPKTFDEFLELVKIIPQEAEKAKSLRQLDFILKKVFLNFTVKDGKVTNYTLNPIFNKVYKLPNVFSSELRVTCLELYDYIIENKTKVDETIEYFKPILYGSYAYKQVNLEGVVL